MRGVRTRGAVRGPAIGSEGGGAGAPGDVGGAHGRCRPNVANPVPTVEPIATSDPKAPRAAPRQHPAPPASHPARVSHIGRPPPAPLLPNNGPRRAKRRGGHADGRRRTACSRYPSPSARLLAQPW